MFSVDAASAIGSCVMPHARPAAPGVPVVVPVAVAGTSVCSGCRDRVAAICLPGEAAAAATALVPMVGGGSRELISGGAGPSSRPPLNLSVCCRRCLRSAPLFAGLDNLVHAVAATIELVPPVRSSRASTNAAGYATGFAGSMVPGDVSVAITELSSWLVSHLDRVVAPCNGAELDVTLFVLSALCHHGASMAGWAATVEVAQPCYSALTHRCLFMVERGRVEVHPQASGSEYVTCEQCSAVVSEDEYTSMLQVEAAETASRAAGPAGGRAVRSMARKLGVLMNLS